MKTYLDAPCNEKNIAKSLGAYWDYQEKRWYAADRDEELVKKWSCRSEGLEPANRCVQCNCHT